MTKKLMLALLVTVATASFAEAAIPVIDKAILTRKTKTQDSTTKTVSLQKGTLGNTDGTDCAVHETDQWGLAAPGLEDGSAEDGVNAVTRYGGLKGFRPAGTPGGGGEEHLRSQIGKIMGDAIAGAAAVATTIQLFEQLTDEIGKNKTVKGSYDQNSMVNMQVGFGQNDLVKRMNSFTEAINLKNEMTALDYSQGGTSLDAAGGAQCQPGTAGRGSVSQPCATQTCIVVDRTKPLPASCISVRLLSESGQVMMYLVDPADHVQISGTVLEAKTSPTELVIQIPE